MAAEGVQVQSPAAGSARSWLLPAALLAASLIGSAWLGAPAIEPDRPVAALFPPWWEAGRSLGAAAAAGGAVLSLGRLPGLVVARSAAPGFAQRLHAAGALLLFDPRDFALCTPAPAPRPLEPRP